MATCDTLLLAWWFCPEDRRLRNSDGRPVILGVPLLVAGEPIPCMHGLHASERLIDALDHVEDSALLHRVRLSGQIVRGRDQCVATERTSLWEVECTGILSQFSRECAFAAIKVSRWKAQHVIIDYLTTGRRDLREEAQNTAIATAKSCTAGGGAVRSAAWAVAWAAWHQGSIAAGSRAAAWEAAEAAPQDRAAIREQQNTRLTELVLEQTRELEARVA